MESNKSNNQLLFEAASQRDANAVSCLIPVSDPKTNDSQALRVAALNGHTECVKLLIPVSDPKALNSRALRWSAQNGHTECVRLLIAVSDGCANDSEALVAAALYNHEEIVDLLWDVSDVTAALKVLQKGYAAQKHLWGYVQHKWEVQVQRQALMNAVDSVTDAACEAGVDLKKCTKI